jgi:hypothetical protein
MSRCCFGFVCLAFLLAVAAAAAQGAPKPEAGGKDLRAGLQRCLVTQETAAK